MIQYTQVSFKTPRARVEYAEACIEVCADKIAAAYEDGDLLGLVDECERLVGELAELARAREAELA